MTRYDDWKTAHPSWYELDPCYCGCCGEEIDYEIDDDELEPEDLDICAACEEKLDEEEEEANQWANLFDCPEMLGAATHKGGGR